MRPARLTTTRRALIVGVWLAAGCAAPTTAPTWESVGAQIDDTFPDVAHITTAELGERLDRRDRPVLLLDVRSAEEYAVSHLADAIHVTTPEAARALLGELPPETLVVAYCSVGYRSAALVEAVAPGTNLQIVNLGGSIFAWANEERGVVRAGAPVDVVHPYDDRWGQLLDRRYWPDDWR